MEKVLINVYSNLNNIEENNSFLAIKNDNLIEYIDLENNKMMIDIKNNIIIRENSDYIFKIMFNSNEIDIEIKKMHKIMKKSIKTLSVSLTKKYYSVKYLLTDENVINEYYVKF